MAKYLVIHSISKPITFEEAASFGKKARANITIEAYWVESWAQLNEEGKIDKILCEWNATDMNAVRKVLAKVSKEPVEGIYRLIIVNSEDFR